MRTWTKGMNWFWAALLGLLGFSGCEKASAPEYGLPPTEYVTVKGSVGDKATGKPIRGIRVMWRGLRPDYPEGAAIPMYGIPPANYFPLLGQTLTEATGGFRLAGEADAEDIETKDGRRMVSLSIEDIDGAANGTFRSAWLTVDLDTNNTATVQVELTETGAE